MLKMKILVPLSLALLASACLKIEPRVETVVRQDPIVLTRITADSVIGIFTLRWSAARMCTLLTNS
jgi:hypothetical protein